MTGWVAQCGVAKITKIYKRNFDCSASLLRVTKTVLNIIIDLFDKNFFFAKSNLEMIGKDDKISYYILKSKSAFKFSFQTLSKLEEQIILHLQYNFESFKLKQNSFT